MVIPYFTIITLEWTKPTPLKVTFAGKISVHTPSSLDELYLHCLKIGAEKVGRDKSECSVVFWYAGPDEIKESA